MHDPSLARSAPAIATTAAHRLDAARRALGRGLAAAALVWAAGLSLRAAPTLLPGGPPVDAERARVLEVVDGDTIVLEDGRHVRLLGIDSPETRHPGLDRAQPLGPEAAARLRTLVEGRQVALERDHSDRDHYGRLLRHVWLGRRLVTEWLLREGLAWRLALPPDSGHAARLDRAERAARGARRGLWGLPRPTALPLFGTPGKTP